MTVSPLATVTIKGYSGHTEGPNGKIVRIVVHGTVSACVRGGARQVAAYFQSAQSGGLAHYVVDPGEIVNCADEDIATWGAPPNQGEIHVELCDPQAGDPARWEDADHQAMLKLAAELVADIARRRGVPPLRLSVVEVAANASGICGHAEVSAAFHQTDHQDPDVAGPFPWTTFMVAVAGLPASTNPLEELLSMAASDPGFAVRFLYRFCLHREVDAGGYADFVGQIQRGTPLDTVMASLQDSAEGKAAIAAERKSLGLP